MDDDCDEDIDDDDSSLDPLSLLVWAVDDDGDGFGDPDLTLLACDQPVGAVGNVDDCDDGNPALGLLEPWVKDNDGDGFGAGVSIVSCAKPGGGYVRLSLGEDCDDTNVGISPVDVEVCGDGMDQDCSGADLICPLSWPGNYAADIVFDEYLDNIPVAMAWDGVSLWTVTQTGVDSRHMAEYLPDGTSVAIYTLATDFRGLASFVDGDTPLFARVKSLPGLLELHPVLHTFAADATLVGGTLDPDSNVVWDDTTGEYLALDDDGIVDRWDASGAWVGSVSLAGFGTLFSESNFPQDRRLAVAEGTLLTYSMGTLSAWDRSGTRLDTTNLLAAGVLADSHWSFSFAASRVWVIDDADANWRAYPIAY